MFEWVGLFFRAYQVSKEYVRTVDIIHACRIGIVLQEHGALGICKSPACTFTLRPSICCVPFFLVSERSGRNCPLREAHRTCMHTYRRFSPSKLCRALSSSPSGLLTPARTDLPPPLQNVASRRLQPLLAGRRARPSPIYQETGGEGGVTIGAR